MDLWKEDVAEKRDVVDGRRRSCVSSCAAAQMR